MTLNRYTSAIGADHQELRTFEGQYPVAHGVSYNSYLIADNQTAIIDAVDIHRSEQWLDNIRHALGNRRPDYIVVQHMEPDHSGSLRALLELYTKIKVVATPKAIGMMTAFFEGLDLNGRTIPVADNDTLCLGHTNLRFLTAPMVHWPEVMMTLDETNGVLFSADAFGSFGPMNGNGAWPDEARRYYCNIVGKYGSSVQAIMKKLQGTGFSTVAPLHGPVLTGDLATYWNLYDRWSRYEPEEPQGVLVAYASVYGATAQAALHTAAHLRSLTEAPVATIDLNTTDVSEAVAQAFRMGRWLLASPTYDAGIFPSMACFLHHLQSKALRNRRVGLIENGSWAPVAARAMAAELDKMKDITIVNPVVTIHSALHSTDYPALDALARALAE